MGLSLDPEEEERIRRRQAGTQVNPSSFLAWKEKFDAEMSELELLKNPSAGVTVVDDRVCGCLFFTF